MTQRAMPTRGDPPPLPLTPMAFQKTVTPVIKRVIPMIKLEIKRRNSHDQMRNSQLMKETLIVLNGNIKHRTCVALLQHFFKHQAGIIYFKP
jgi:hypothetical protein